MDGITLFLPLQSGDKEGAEEASTPSTPEGRVAVVIIPSLSMQHLKYLNSHTYFYKVQFLRHRGLAVQLCSLKSAAKNL